MDFVYDRIACICLAVLITLAVFASFVSACNPELAERLAPSIGCLVAADLIDMWLALYGGTYSR